MSTPCGAAVTHTVLDGVRPLQASRPVTKIPVGDLAMKRRCVRENQPEKGLQRAPGGTIESFDLLWERKLNSE